jgi:predicted RNA-binding Zn ribbon-like protein
MLSLDFINTVDDRLSERPIDTLASYRRFLDWAVRKNIIDQLPAQELQEKESDPDSALGEVRKLRELLYRMFSAVAREERVVEADLFNRYLAQAMSSCRISQTQEGFAWTCRPAEGSAESVLYPIVKSAVDLLVSAEIDRIRICADPSCGWLFLDSSRNRSRRWCSMEGCGNRAKARRFYQRHQQMPGQQKS